MGAYAMPDNKPFRSNGNIKRKRKKGRVDEGLALIRSGKLKVDLKNETVRIERNDG